MSQRRDDNRNPDRGGRVDRPASIPDDLVDRFFDDELSDPDRRAFLHSLPSDLARCEDVAKTRRAIDMLRAGSVPAPDLTGRIIATVDSRRGFASRRVRQMARVVRLGLAAGVVLFAGAIAAVERVAPDATRLVPAPTPLSTAIRESRAEMASTSGAVATWFETLRHGVRGDEDASGRDSQALVVRVDAGSDPQPGVAGVRQIMVLHSVGDAPTLAFTPALGATLAQDRNGAPVRVISASAFAMKSDSREAAWERVRQSRRANLMYDVEGRCGGVVTPLGVHISGDESRPFVLPGGQP
ncbi:MAG: hypothetical protein KDA05_04475 [Phycisphaerales bacterium]|nr:hypothetical protein [Phycisphaerales bacterium]MCB9840804.1 hypothetical protein [Phycisphaeraceae bacterium]